MHKHDILDNYTTKVQSVWTYDQYVTVYKYHPMTAKKKDVNFTADDWPAKTCGYMESHQYHSCFNSDAI
jgi:hypothetical protein